MAGKRGTKIRRGTMIPVEFTRKGYVAYGEYEFGNSRDPAYAVVHGPTQKDVDEIARALYMGLVVGVTPI